LYAVNFFVPREQNALGCSGFNYPNSQLWWCSRECPPKNAKAAGVDCRFKNKSGSARQAYFLSSFFFGLHFSQTFFCLAASWQHLWLHSFFAFFASSQQLADTLKVPPKTANAPTKVKIFRLFIAWEGS
jgi:hypothetical protein